jgi:hypothetical protein
MEGKTWRLKRWSLKRWSLGVWEEGGERWSQGVWSAWRFNPEEIPHRKSKAGERPEGGNYYLCVHVRLI